MGLVKKNKIIWDIISIHKYRALFLVGLTILYALLEVVGIGMLFPLLGLMVESNNVFGGYTRYLALVLKNVPKNYWMGLILGLLLFLTLFKSFVALYKTRQSESYSRRFQKLWMEVIAEKYLYADYPFLLNQKQGKMISNLITEPNKAATAVKNLIQLFSNIILGLFFYLFLLLIDWRVTLIITFGFLGIEFTTRKIYGYVKTAGEERLKLHRETISVLAEGINCIRQVKIFSLENKVYQSFIKKWDSLISIFIKIAVINATPLIFVENVMVLGIVSFLVYFYYFSATSFIEILPALGIFILVGRRLSTQFAQITKLRLAISFAMPSLELVYDLSKSEIDKEELESGEVINQLTGDIIFHNIQFSYNKSVQLFQDFNIRFPKGRITAIVGPSGAGKSTIVDLLFGFLKCKQGEILINGTDLRKINLRSWRRIVGYVSQDITLFNTSIRENILIGNPDATDEEIIYAAKKANADQFIRELPHGYNTHTGERGLKLSGGQRQRIAIARAIIRDPALYIFDEATSSLDLESEKLIQESINDISKYKTIIIITHRLPSVKKADIIHVLDNGRILESGTFKELEEKNSRFYRMINT